MPRVFAVIPAAGQSRRMGRPKLLLPSSGRTVIARLLAVLDHPGIADRCVVVRRSDQDLQREVAACGATLLLPVVDPPDMRGSVQYALAQIAHRHAPAPEDGWLLIPADHALLSSAVLQALLNRWASTPVRILVPAFQGRRGHPTLFRWELADAVDRLPPDAGLNRLLQHYAADVVELSVSDPGVLADLDTPEDYQKLQRLAVKDE